MISLEVPRRFRPLIELSQEVARNYFRPISRKYDRAEHVYPKELDLLATAIDAMNVSSGDGAGATAERGDRKGSRGGGSMGTVLAIIELCWGDAAMVLTMPRQGLGNAAIAAVATPEQKARFAGKWAAMAITEPGAGSDSAAIRTTARKDGDHWVIDGEKIYVTCGERADLIVVWASIDRDKGRAAIKSFVVEKGTPGMELVRLDKKMGIRASDTAVIRFEGCRVAARNLLGTEEIGTSASFAGAMKTFDNTRPMVAGMAVGVARAALERAREITGVVSKHRALYGRSDLEAELDRMDAELEAARLMAMEAAWLADEGIGNSLEASMAKAKAARVGNEITLRCVELCGVAGYEERELLEKWARDSKILDIFEGTQQIQMLIVARHLFGKRSSELR